MPNNTRVFIKIALIAAVVPLLIHAFASGPDPGKTGAPGDQTCIQGGCHVGTANSGPGNVKVLLPAGNSGSYTPGQTMRLTVQITDATKRSYGFQLTARSGSTNRTQAGDFATIDANTQVLCADGSVKANGKTCPVQFPNEYIEHTRAGWSNSLSGNGSYTYSFDWTPPAAAVGAITLYVAANCGLGTDNNLGTNVYIPKIPLSLMPAAANPGPSISNVLDAASFQPSVVPGSWVAIFGQGLAGTNRQWAASDFSGNNLPSTLDGVTVTFGNLPASVLYVSPTQLDVQAPSGISGTVPVTVSYSGSASAFNAVVAQNAPSLFTYPSGSNTFAAAQHLGYQLIGDPAVTPGSAPSNAGEQIILYASGIAPSPSGVLIGAPISYSGGLSVSIGSAPAPVSFVGLVAAGLYQINATVPSGLSPGTYPITVQTGGQSSQPSVMLPVGP
jgi:uncharacterized protein (TIGR03437 family)